MHLEASQITMMLQALVDGKEEPKQDFVDAVYSELRVLASKAMKGEKRNHSLQPTELVNEAYLKLLNGKSLDLNSRTHFFALAAAAMKKILIDHARAKNASKRGGDLVKVSLNEGPVESRDEIDLLALDELLDILKKIAPRQHQILELRFFGGLKIKEIAVLMKLSPAMIAKELTKAKGWLFSHLS